MLQAYRQTHAWLITVRHHRGPLNCRGGGLGQRALPQPSSASAAGGHCRLCIGVCPPVHEWVGLCLLKSAWTPYLPGNNKLPYQLRTRHYNRSLIIKTNYLNNSEFIIRMLYKYSYWMFLLWTVNITDSLPEIRHWQYSLQSLFYFWLYVLCVCLLVVIWCTLYGLGCF